MSLTGAPLAAFTDILVTPYTALLEEARGRPNFQGGPHWPDFASQGPARHYCRGKPVDLPPLPASGSLSYLPGRFAWGGGLLNHFGHQVADFSMRLGPTLMAEPEAVFLFASRVSRGVMSWSDTQPFFRGILEWFELDETRVRIISEPTVVGTLVVAPQAEQRGLASPPSDDYLDYLDALVRRHFGELPRTRAVYVGRSRMASHLAGERYLERLLREAGVIVVHPETLPLEAQLRHYCCADHLAVAEGSALHGLQLLGRSLRGVSVILRRAGGLSWLEPALRSRTSSIEFVDLLRGALLPADIRGSEQHWWNMGIIDEARLAAALPAIVGEPGLADDVRRRWNPVEFHAQVEVDILQWASHLCRSRSMAFPESLGTIVPELERCGLAHLGRAVEQRLVEGFLKSVPQQVAQAAEGDHRAPDPATGGFYARVIETVQRLVPEGGELLVISMGDPYLVGFAGIRARHFPSADDGSPLGHHPSDSSEAIAWLDAAVDAGAAYLLIPAPQLWWLTHYEAFARHLERRFTTAATVQDACVLFAVVPRSHR